MIEVWVVSAFAGRVQTFTCAPSYVDFAKAIGTTRFQIKLLDGGDSIFYPEDDGTGTFEMDHVPFNAPAIIFRQGEYSVPESPRMSLDEAKRRVSHLKDAWDGYDWNAQ